MFGKKKNAGTLNYEIKLLSGNNVVLVEAEGYESELFIPRIHHGRIDFHNIVPNRRCCKKVNDITCKTVKSHRLDSALTHRQEPSMNASRMFAGQEISGLPKSPLIQNLSRANKLHTRDKENVERKPVGINKASLSTDRFVTASPEAPRWTPVPSPSEVMKDTVMHIPKGIKVVRLYRNPTTSTPNKVGRVLDTNVGIPSTSCNSPITARFSLLLPTTPRLTPRSPRSFRKSTFACPTQSSQQKTVGSPACLTKWRKCLTPIRTYSRRAGATMEQRSSCCSLKKSAMHIKKVRPTYMANPTQGPKGTHELDVRKRKLIVDTKVVISPSTFKRQQSGDNFEKVDVQRISPKNRQQYKNIKESAFDMLTNSNRMNAMCPKLVEQFRKGCTNKASSTHPKYKLLCALPPLEHNSATHGIRRQIHSVMDMHRADNVISKQQGIIYDLSSDKSALLSDKADAQEYTKGVTFKNCLPI